MSGRFSSISAEIPDARFEFYALGDGARLRYIVLEPQGTPRGTFLIIEGRREFIEKKYFEIGRDLLIRGFRIICFDARGQGFSSRLFDGDRHQRDHVVDFGIYLNDLRAFYRDVVKPRQSGPLFVFAHSLGGLIVTRWLAEKTGSNAPDIKAIIMTAPALAIGVPPLSRPISRIAAKLGRGERYAVGQRDYGGQDRRFKFNVLSHDPVRFSIIEKYFDSNSDLKVGGVTWSWLAAALDCIKLLHEPGYLERVTTPVLALFGGKDIVTPPAKIIPLIRRMPNAECVLIPGALHDLMNEADKYRNKAWGCVDGFLKHATRINAK